MTKVATSGESVKLELVLQNYTTRPSPLNYLGLTAFSCTLHGRCVLQETAEFLIGKQ